MDANSLTGAQRSHLRGLGQRLEPAIKLGREGVSPTVVRELDRLLTTHELIKVRFLQADRDERATLCERVATDLRCICVGAVGHTALFFRQNETPADRQIEFP